MVDLDAIESAADRWSAAPTFKEANAIAARLCDAIPAFVAELRRLREREAPGTFADAIAAAAAIPKRLLDSMPAESIFPVTRGLMVRVEREIRALSPEATPPTFADGFARGIEAALERVRTIGAPTSAKALIALLDEEIRALAPAAVPGGDVAGLVEEALRLCANRDEAKELFRQRRDVRGYEAALEYPRARLAEIAELLARALQAPAGKDRP